jgi:hypothetical protein
MQRSGAKTWLAIVCSAVLSLSSPALAQRLYDKELDDKAQAAQKLGADVLSGGIFDKQLQNLATLARQDVAIYFMDVKRELRAAIDALTTWSQVDNLIIRSPSARPTKQDVDDEKANLKKALTAAEEALQALKAKKSDPKDPLASVFGHIGDVSSAYAFSESIIEKGTNDAATINVLKKTGESLGKLKDLYDTYAKRIDDIRNLDAQLDALKVPLEEVALDTLRVDEEHLNTLAAIEARRQADQSDIETLITFYDTRRQELASLGAGKAIKDSLLEAVNRRDAPQLLTMLLALHAAVAIKARQSSPDALANLRVAQEQHRYSIRRSAVIARSYEVVVLTGTQRLALYHKGGIKHETVAQIVQAVATMAIPPAILAK